MPKLLLFFFLILPVVQPKKEIFGALNIAMTSTMMMNYGTASDCQTKKLLVLWQPSNFGIGS